MMKNSQPDMMRVVFVGALAVCLAAAVCAAQSDPLGYALLVQQSPADGGSVTPGAGVHKIGVGQTVQWSAVPRPGYKFMYWLGDVSGTMSSETTIRVDSPKLVVAVFEREGFEDELLAANPQAGAGRGGLRFNPNSVNPASISGGGGGRPLRPFSIPTPPQDEFFDDDFPVPGDKDDPIGVPGDETGEDTVVPEPATVLLLGLGAVLLRKRKQ